ncbi:NF-X1-type zinc finger protein NFXL1 [Tanacetum coccineum]
MLVIMMMIIGMMDIVIIIVSFNAILVLVSLVRRLLHQGYVLVVRKPLLLDARIRNLFLHVASVVIDASCFCKKKIEVIVCGDMVVKGYANMENDGIFSCNSSCGKPLGCGNHVCKETCHPGVCGDCELLPQVGFTSWSLWTVECFNTATTMTDEFKCDKPCGRKKNCGRHRCSDKCCPLSNSKNSAATQVERKKVLADAFGVDTNLEALHFGESSAVSDMLGDLFRRDPKWVLSVEEICKIFSREDVELNDKNALAVFSDLALAATAMRRLDHGSVYHGASVLSTNGTSHHPSVITTDSWIVAQEWVNPETSPWKVKEAPLNLHFVTIDVDIMRI